MNIYSISWRIPGGGSYVQRDPMYDDGGYYKDLKGVDLITSKNCKIAREAVLIARPNARVLRAKKISEAQ